jgi:hypothetical protein
MISTIDVIQFESEKTLEDGIRKVTYERCFTLYWGDYLQPIQKHQILSNIWYLIWSGIEEDNLEEILNAYSVSIFQCGKGYNEHDKEDILGRIQHDLEIMGKHADKIVLSRKTL